MKRWIEFPLEDGGTILVEVEDSVAGRLAPVSRPGELITQAGQSFQSALEKVRSMADGVIMQLKDLPERPDEIEVEFGLKLSAEAGAVLASAGAEANYIVKLTWKPSAKDKPAAD